MINRYLLLLFFTLLTASAINGQEVRLTAMEGNAFTLRLKPEEAPNMQAAHDAVTVIDYYRHTDPSQPGTYKLPSQTLLLAIPEGVEPAFRVVNSSARRLPGVVPAVNPRYELENDSTWRAVEIPLRQRVLKEKTGGLVTINGYSYFRDFYCVSVTIATHTYNESLSELTVYDEMDVRVELPGWTGRIAETPMRVVSDFEESMQSMFANAEVAEQFRLRARPQKDYSSYTGWIPYGSEFLQLGVWRDGIHRITGSLLQQQGIAAGSVDPASFRLYESGIERPIRVVDGGDGSFDAADYIEFYGEKNYNDISPRVINSDSEPYNEYMNRYTDTTSFFLTWGGDGGRRIVEQSTQPAQTSGTLTTSLAKLHFERHELDALFYTFHQNLIISQLPQWNTSKSWYWEFLAEWRPSFSLDISLPNRTAGTPADFFAKIISRGAVTNGNAHNLWLYVNDEEIASKTAIPLQRVLLEGAASAASLDGGPVALEIKYENYPTAQNGVMLVDWVEVDYTRDLTAVDDSLHFTVAPGVEPGVYSITATGFSGTTLNVYKVSPVTKRITAYDLSNGELQFADTLQAGDRYVIEAASAYATPKVQAAGTFTDLRQGLAQTDYIAITHLAFYESAQQYLETVQQVYDLQPVLVDVASIYQQYSYGYPEPEAIKRFLDERLSLLPAPLPSYLVLIGDANYDYKGIRFQQSGVRGGGNYVPSYGFPVSDPWYVMFDDAASLLPQMFVGRLAINSATELEHYRQKLINNAEVPWNRWNKRYLFFAGGRPDVPGETDRYKAANDVVINEYIKPRPLAGLYTNFYKTASPATDFGPYTPEFVEHKIDEGGVFISYIGHSGTATWDNSITETTQLKNTAGRNPLVTDFGCSTNKFAEPDIVAFGERFTLYNQGQAIAYVGNSALGFDVSAIAAPDYFYESLTTDKEHLVGRTHFQTKNRIYNFAGQGDLGKVFLYSNVLLGDPAVQIRIPDQADLAVLPDDLRLEAESLNDRIDSVAVTIRFRNQGLAEMEQYTLSVEHRYQGELLNSATMQRTLPTYADSVSLWIQTADMPGDHKVALTLDAQNDIAELNEENNQQTFSLLVSSTEVRDLLSFRVANPAMQYLTLLSPSVTEGESARFIVETADNESFNSAQSITVTPDTFSTSVPLAQTDNRLWVRYRLDNEPVSWNAPVSFHADSAAPYMIADSTAFAAMNLAGLTASSRGAVPLVDSITIVVTSAGSFSGEFCTITRNGVNLLSNTFFTGIGIVQFDANTFEPLDSQWWQLFNINGAVEDVTNYINAIPDDVIVALGVSGDATNNWNAGLREAVVSLGGASFPELEFKAPYALIGGKNISADNVIEVIKAPNEGIVTIDTTVVVSHDGGRLATGAIGPAAAWNRFEITSAWASTSTTIIGQKNDGALDTLFAGRQSPSIELSGINANVYPYLFAEVDLNANGGGEPELNSIAVHFDGPAELGTNSEAVSISADSVVAGEPVDISFTVFNAAQVEANPHTVTLHISGTDGEKTLLKTWDAGKMEPRSRAEYQFQYVTTNTPGAHTFLISIDSKDNVFEYYEDNNLFQDSFTVLGDTSLPSLRISFDGVEIFDGDYINNRPEITVELSDPSSIPVADTSAVTILLDQQQLYYATGELTYDFQASNPKMTVTARPELDGGEHSLWIFGEDASGNQVNPAGIQKSFMVEGETKLLEVYNYPNPAVNETWFTFKLTQVPESLKILVYTVAGRKIREIEVPASSLRHDFNTVHWDLRDQDGDLIANGTYLYKVVLKQEGKTISAIEKVSIVR